MTRTGDWDIDVVSERVGMYAIATKTNHVIVYLDLTIYAYDSLVT